MLCAVLWGSILHGQQGTVISGSVHERGVNAPIGKTSLAFEGTSLQFFTDNKGHFQFDATMQGEQILVVSAPDFLSKRFVLYLDGSPIDLGAVYLERDIEQEQTDNLITLTDTELLDDEMAGTGGFGLLQSTRDVYLNRAAFDFGQAFFKVRGYDSRNGEVLLNGIPMNKFFDGRPQWNNWGGLNDVLRNQEYTNTLAVNPNTFGGILGNTNINLRPSGMRPGTRLSSSLSNRTYRGRLMATYALGSKANGLAYAFSASRRWASEGYVQGTLYDAYSLFGSVEYQFNRRNNISITSILASNRRGRSAALTEEVFELVGNRYNPYWGEQEGKIRNARERKVMEPIFLLNYIHESEKIEWKTGLGYQTGVNKRSRLGYFNAPNPDPTYYKYVPSYHINSPLGADFINASLAKEAFLENPQLSWDQMYAANQNTEGAAAYLLSDDVTEDKTITANSTFKYRISTPMEMGVGIHYRSTNSANYALLTDLLGAEFHNDLDTFSNTHNDTGGSLQKIEQDKFGYNYGLESSLFGGFGQFQTTFKKWSAFASVAFSNFATQRNGLFTNERYLENSFGPSEEVTFSNLGYKGGVTYFVTGRHWITGQAAKLERPPTLQNIFINPRENNAVVPDIQKELLTTVDLSYHLRLPTLTGRISAFYSRFMNTTDINFFYVDSGLGSDFVQEVITGLDRLHKGIEFGFEYEASSSVKLTIAGNLGHYTYASDPNVEINFDTSGEDVISIDGVQDLGIAGLKGLRLAQGPQTALAFGVNYRSPKYWWIGATANYLTHNYINVSTIARTNSFLLDPETGVRFPDATAENVTNALRQRKLEDIYLLNLVGGKSWLWGKKYISVFASASNLFDLIYRSGGYEQSRNGNYGQWQKDNLSGTPSFGPKYWYGYGRTYFLNLAISF